MKNKLLTRDDFRNQVFERDNHCCVICGEKGEGDCNTREYNLDAHHIVERKLFHDGGYYLNNGSSLCSSCHIKAEKTLISCSDIRKACGITNVILPEHLDECDEYTKWGDVILANGTRCAGELFNEESTQKALVEVLRSERESEQAFKQGGIH